MTREHRLLLSLDEIHAVRWTCRKCGSTVSYQLDQSIRLPQNCHACQEPFLERAAGADFQQLQACVDTLKMTLRALRSGQVGATLQLEFLDDAKERA